jgi:hypothetical protein
VDYRRGAGRRASYAGERGPWRVTDGVATSLSGSGLFAGAAAFVGPRTVLALRRIGVSENVPVTDGLWRRRARACGYGQRVQPRRSALSRQRQRHAGGQGSRPEGDGTAAIGRKEKAWYAYG